MADKNIFLTYAGLKQYEDELQNLKVVKRKEVAQKIKEAREQETSQRMRSMMQQRMSRGISSCASRSWRSFSRARRLS